MADWHGLALRGMRWLWGGNQMKGKWRVVNGVGKVIRAGFLTEQMAYKWMHEHNNEQSKSFHFWIVEETR
jgi:hypothetical protein